MSRRDIVIGIIILAVVGFFIYRSQNVPNPQITSLPETSIEDKVKDKFNVDLPENAEKAELTSPNKTADFGVAVREEEGDVLGYSVLADLPDPTGGEFYQAWLVEGENYESLGKLTLAKGGWLLDTSMSTESSADSEVVVTKEKIFDSTPEEEVLRGSF